MIFFFKAGQQNLAFLCFYLQFLEQYVLRNLAVSWERVAMKCLLKGSPQPSLICHQNVGGWIPVFA